MDGCLDTLAARYGFRPEFDLHCRLQRLKQRYSGWQRLRTHTPSQRRDAAQNMVAAVDNLFAAARQLDAVGGGFLLTDGDGEPLLAGDVLKALQQVGAQAGGVRVTARAKTGRAPDLAKGFLVANLWRIYRDGTGRDDVGGRFDDFADEVAENVLGVSIGRATIMRLGIKTREKISTSETGSD